MSPGLWQLMWRPETSSWATCRLNIVFHGLSPVLEAAIWTLWSSWRWGLQTCWAPASPRCSGTAGCLEDRPQSRRRRPLPPQCDDAPGSHTGTAARGTSADAGQTQHSMVKTVQCVWLVHCMLSNQSQKQIVKTVKSTFLQYFVDRILLSLSFFLSFGPPWSSWYFRGYLKC